MKFRLRTGCALCNARRMPTERRNASGEPLVGSSEAADILGVDKATLVRWVARGRVAPVHKLPGGNGAFLFSRAVIIRLAQERIARQGAA